MARYAAQHDPLLSGLAGTYDSETDAQAVVRNLQAGHGLQPSQWALLRPADGAWWRYTWARQRWALGGNAAAWAWQEGLAVTTASAVLLAGVGAAIGLWVDDGLDLGQVAAATVLAGLLAAMASAAVSFGAGSQPQQKRFDQALRKQLKSGRWVVIAHHVPAARQTGVALVVREHSVRWYSLATSPAPWH